MHKNFKPYPYYNKDNVLCIGMDYPVAPNDTYSGLTGKEIIKECKIAFIQNARNREWTNVMLRNVYGNLIQGTAHK
jgi:hypothetical protein